MLVPSHPTFFISFTKKMFHGCEVQFITLWTYAKNCLMLEYTTFTDDWMFFISSLSTIPILAFKLTLHTPSQS